MEEMQNSKGVSLVFNPNPCLVKSISAEEFPSQIGFSGKDDLQEKKESIETEVNLKLPNEFDLDFPPGFDGLHSTVLLNRKHSQIPLTKWRSPPKLMLDPRWLIGSGEESEQVEAQNQRERRVLEAMYPRSSDIPPDPFMLMDIDNFSINNNENTPIIPMTPIEDGDPTMENNAIYSTKLIDFATAACKVLTSSMASGEAVYMDPDLLFHTLTNPKIVENLIRINETAKPNSAVPSHHVSPQKILKEALPIVRPPSIKNDDIGVRQYGCSSRESSSSNNNNYLERIIKPCMYFKSRRGCRNGANCSYKHNL
ncbi:zinc finger CCCH domain-containing protein 6-like [Impatiens glandulifera]|uniref:zinc finger CCCH domain-containing protein 6-like n=1 Tax=Impatiens glandulifera TaxID=253017 RepID=UPI001FB0CBAC|nr:zinc finger CCCH domain-containing protein 6-like [Impatiens glandulifera]